MNKSTRLEFFQRLAAQRPEPTTELLYDSGFELLVAVMLSAQSTDVGVNKVTRRLYPVANTPAQILALGEAALESYLRTLGLYRAKTKNVLATSHILLNKYASEVPEDRAALESLPGVGRKTANVVLNTLFRQPVMAVDTHIFRVANRTGLAPGKTVLAVETQLMKHVPKDYLIDAHHWLILHGRYTCKARKPDCGACIVCDLCDYRSKPEPCNPEFTGKFSTPEAPAHVQQ
ncbi:endonuclease III [Halothiobacillus sp.]|uniref:endonuclease III n=1 Tax=Halothiobacillus sp. TaxID=1891311 RepID=UPI002AD25D24|nr:endonuclease III [Halothiobacillus sp.]